MAKENKRVAKSTMTKILSDIKNKDWDFLTEEEKRIVLKQEKEERDNLKTGFQIIKESTDPIIVASNRVEISRKWAKILLRISFWLNIVTISCFSISAVLVLLKPSPNFYASTPSGKIIGPLNKINLKK